MFQCNMDLTKDCNLCRCALTFDGLVRGDAGVVGSVHHPCLEHQEVASAGLNEVGIVFDPDTILEPVDHLGLGIALWRMAAELGLASKLDLLRIRRCVKLFSEASN